MKLRISLTVLISFVLIVLSLAQESRPLTAETRKAAIQRIGTLLVENYVFEDVAKQCSSHLQKKLADGAFDSFTSAESFAGALTKELQSISHDKHMRVGSAPRQTSSGMPNPILAYVLAQKAAAKRIMAWLARRSSMGTSVSSIFMAFRQRSPHVPL